MAAEGILLKCSKCNNTNYITKRNTKQHPEKFTFKKYCNTCFERTEHKETKKK